MIHMTSISVIYFFHYANPGSTVNFAVFSGALNTEHTQMELITNWLVVPLTSIQFILTSKT